MTNQPVVILGGFLIGVEAYELMRLWLEDSLNQPVVVVPATRLDWFLTSTAWGWRRLLDRTAALVDSAAGQSTTGKVTLIGHSSGGVMLRLLLSADPWMGRCYGAQRWVDRLYTLGSPHTALRATAMRAFVDQRWPGAFFAPDVDYVAVAGELDLAEGFDLSRRVAKRSYTAINGDPDAAGDGLVPVGSALLAGAQPLVLPGVAHGGAFGPRWYGTPEVVERWWRG